MFPTSTSKLARIAALTSLLSLPSQAQAGTKTLTLTASGTMVRSPLWLGATSDILTTQTFSFEGIIAGPTAVDVTSADVTIKLVGVTAYPATVALVRPSSCTIGSEGVADTDVHFVNNGSIVTADTALSIASDATQTYALRFAAAGNYSDKAGAVSCGATGSLTYTY